MNVLEMSEVSQYIESLEDSHIKELLNRMHMEYTKYRLIGTPKECADYKEYCKMSVMDVLKMMWNTSKFLSDENECQKRFYENQIKKLKEQNNGRKNRPR